MPLGGRCHAASQSQRLTRPGNPMACAVHKLGRLLRGTSSPLAQQINSTQTCCAQVSRPLYNAARGRWPADAAQYI